MINIFDASVRFWAWIRDLEKVLVPCRFSAVVILGGAALLFSAQGQELTVRLPSESWWKSFWFNVGVLLWAFQSWYWARIILDMTYGADRGASLEHPRVERIRCFIRWAPRVMAIGSYLVAFIAVILTGFVAWKIALALVVVGAIFIVGLVYRKNLTDKLLGTVKEDQHSWKYQVLVARKGDPDRLLSVPLASQVILWITFSLWIGLTAWVCVSAVSFGWAFGAAAVPFIGFSMIVAGGSFLVIKAHPRGAKSAQQSDGSGRLHQRGYPVITTLFVIAFVFSLFPFFDNHKVRTMPLTDGRGTSVEDVLDNWYVQTTTDKDANLPKNFVVVASAGGGLRAAYWTATVLGHIQDGVPSFRKQLAGMSAVSGGSLGATVFVTLLGEPSLPQKATDCGKGGNSIGAFECAGQKILGQDFLGPTVAALLYPDLIQRVLPLGFPDRAKALEQSWEQAWAAIGFEEGIWRDRGFDELWSASDHLPALMLNGTHVETGKRVLTSNISIDRSPAVFRDVYDFYRLIEDGSTVRPSTAAHNSARFTYVSPASTLEDGTHLVDGGYFENFGAVTAREFIRAATDRFKQKIRPVVILISNDPELTEEELPRSVPGETQRASAKSWAGEVLSPLRALLKARDARGLLAASELRQSVESMGGKYVQFRLCQQGGRSDPALGWVLSYDSEELMREQMRSSVCSNDKQMDKLREVLAGRG